MTSREKKYYGKIGVRAIWTKGKEAHVFNPYTQKWSHIPTRQLLQFGTGQEEVQHPWTNENQHEIRDIKTIRQVIYDVQRG